MSKKQLILDILSKTNKYRIEDLVKLWYSELKILHYAVIKEGKQDVYDLEEVENDK